MATLILVAVCKTKSCINFLFTLVGYTFPPAKLWYRGWTHTDRVRNNNLINIWQMFIMTHGLHIYYPIFLAISLSSKFSFWKFSLYGQECLHIFSDVSCKIEQAVVLHLWRNFGNFLDRQKVTNIAKSNMKKNLAFLRKIKRHICHIQKEYECPNST